MGVIRHALRTLGRSPGLAAVVIVSIGVGIGVNTAVFSWLQAATLKPLPGVSDGASFLTVEPKSDTGTYPGISWLEYHDLGQRLGAFDDLLAFRMAPMSVGESCRTALCELRPVCDDDEAGRRTDHDPISRSLL